MSTGRRSARRRGRVGMLAVGSGRAFDEADDRGVGPAQDSVAMIALAAFVNVAAVALDILPFFHCV